MSHVTDVILTVGCGDSRVAECIAALDSFTRTEARGGTLHKVDQHAGGTKALQAEVYMGAFNYLPVGEFIALVKTLPWEYPEDIRLFMQEEQEYSFRVRA